MSGEPYVGSRGRHAEASGCDRPKAREPKCVRARLCTPPDRQLADAGVVEYLGQHTVVVRPVVGPVAGRQLLSNSQRPGALRWRLS